MSQNLFKQAFRRSLNSDDNQGDTVTDYLNPDEKLMESTADHYPEIDLGSEYGYDEYHRTSQKSEQLSEVAKPRFKFKWKYLSALLVVVLVFGGVIGVYAKHNLDTRQRNLSICQDLLREAEIEGLEIATWSCEADQESQSISPIILVGDFQGEAEVYRIKREIEVARELRDREASDLQREIEQYAQKFEWFGVDVFEMSPLPEDTGVVNQDISQKRAWLESLEEVWEQKIAEFDKLFTDYDELLKSEPDLELSDQRKYVDTVRSLEGEARWQEYQELSQSFAATQTLVRQAVLAREMSMRSSGSTRSASVFSVVDMDRFRIFNPRQFQVLYDAYSYPGVNRISDSPSISGNSQVDARFIMIAQRRGYKLRFEATSSRLQSVSGQSLQPQARQAWDRMVAAARTEGVQLGLVSGYRSVDLQRTLFNDRFQAESVRRIGRAYTADEIIQGQADAAINSVLETSALPGYSKHHTGYTVDVTDLQAGRYFTEFHLTPGYQWISANNYLNAKRFGFIPSYPEGGTNFGPNPESWEYVWVGEEALLS